MVEPNENEPQNGTDDTSRLRRHRYYDLFFLAVVAILICSILQPGLEIVGDKFLSLISGWRPEFQFLQIALIGGAFWALLIWLGGFRDRDICCAEEVIHEYPPVWMCGALSAVLYLWLAHCLKVVDVSWPVLGERCWLLAGLVMGPVTVMPLLTGFGRVSAQKLGKADEEPEGKAVDLLAMTKNEELLKEWLEEEKPIKHPSQDAFGMAGMARRIARILRERPLKAIAVLGGYGSGKSSILNMVDYYLKHDIELEKHLEKQRRVDTKLVKSENVIVCRVGGWGLRKGSVSKHILETIVQELSKHADGLSLGSIPRNYRRAVADLGFPWNLLDILPLDQSPKETLKKLDTILTCIDRRLIVYLEDLDRNENDEKFWNEAAALLDRLQDLKNVSYVVAVRHNEPVILTRIAEHLEVAPELHALTTRHVLDAFHDLCLGAFPDDVDSFTRAARKERLGLNPDEIVGDSALLASKLELIAALTTLAGQPRTLKFGLRKIREEWQSLHGEIDFDDLFVANFLRKGAPDAFDFVIQYKTGMRDPWVGAEAAKDREYWKKKWEEVKKQIGANQDAAEKLTQFLLPRILSDFDKLPPAPQGIVQPGSPDYWARLNAKTIHDDEECDQDVLRAIRDWKHEQDMDLVTRISKGASVAKKVRRFGRMLDDEEARKLASQYFREIREGMKFRHTREEYVGFEDVAGLLDDKQADLDKKWLLTEIEQALLVSLGLANDLTHSLSANQGIIQEDVLALIKKVLAKNPKALIQALKYQPGIVDVFRLVDVHKNTLREWNWTWLGDVLLEAANEDEYRGIVLPYIAGLVIDESFTSGSGELLKYSFNEKLARIIFGKRYEELLEILRGEIDASRFSKDEQRWIRDIQKEVRELGQEGTQETDEGDDEQEPTESSDNPEDET